MEINTKSKVMSGLIWRYAERGGAQIMQFVVSIILANLLSPSDYGLIGLITVFLNIANVFALSGMGLALVQRKDADDVDFSTVFYYSLGFSIILYFVLFAVSPFVASFYEAPVLISVIRVLGWVVVIGAVNSVQQAYVQKTMQFKRFFYATLSGTIVSAVVGIAMAYKGYGVWALVGQQLTNQIVNTIVMWFTLKWRPMLKFSFERMKKLFSFGWKLLCSSLIDTVYQNIYSLVIGKFYSSSDLGYYNKGKSFPMLIINNINTALNSVLLPVMSEAQDEKDRLKAMTRRSIKTSTFVIFPLMAGLAAISEPMVKILLGDKWLMAVPFIQFCCFTYAFWPVNTANLQAITALGRSDIFLKLEIIKKILGVVTLVVTLPYGLTVMMFGRCINAIISLILNAWPNKRLLSYSVFEQMKDVLPSLMLALVMCFVVLMLNIFDINIYLKLVIQILTGGVVYICGAKLFKFDTFDYVFDMVKAVLKRKHK